MKRMMFVMVLAACAGCSSVEKYRGVSKEYDGAGKTVRHIETESIKQTESTTGKITFKHL